MLTARDYQTALDVQDACNLSGVVRSFAEILDKLWEEACELGQGTQYVNEHPVSKLFADKLADLAQVRTLDAYSAAYYAVERVAKA